MNQSPGTRGSDRDWRRWHEEYDDPESRLSRRLAVVRRLVAQSLDEAREGPIRVVSICAGQGRDILEVLRSHPRRGDVSGRLVELDTHNASVARTNAAAWGLERIEVVEADAGRTDPYAGAVPADLVLCCGVFGNISKADIHRTVAALPMLCAAGAPVMWTRSTHAPDLTPTIRRWFAEAGFAELDFIAPTEHEFSVGRHTYVGPAHGLIVGRRLFRFR